MPRKIKRKTYRLLTNKNEEQRLNRDLWAANYWMAQPNPTAEMAENLRCHSAQKTAIDAARSASYPKATPNAHLGEISLANSPSDTTGQIVF